MKLIPCASFTVLPIAKRRAITDVSELLLSADWYLVSQDQDAAYNHPNLVHE